MPRDYRHIKQYENEILGMREKGATQGEIADKIGLTKEQVHHFIKRHHRKERQIAAGIAL